MQHHSHFIARHPALAPWHHPAYDAPAKLARGTSKQGLIRWELYGPRGLVGTFTGDHDFTMKYGNFHRFSHAFFVELDPNSPTPHNLAL